MLKSLAWKKQFNMIKEVETKSYQPLFDVKFSVTLLSLLKFISLISKFMIQFLKETSLSFV